MTGQKKVRMKWNNLAKSAVLGLAVLLATSAFASNKGSLRLSEAAQVNGQQLPAGEYQVRWDGTGDNVDLSFVQGGKVVTKTSAKIVELKSAPSYDAAVVKHDGQSANLQELRFAGKKFALAIGGSNSGEMSGSSSK